MPGALWNFNFAGIFYRHAKSNCISCRFVSADGLCDLYRLLWGFPFGQFLDAAVLVKHPDFEIENSLTNDAETEMPGFDDPGMHRADRNLVDSFAGNLFKYIFVVNRNYFTGNYRLIPEVFP